MAKQEYRVTKYDPRLRDSNGVFHGDAWTCFSDVGKVFGSSELSLAEYEAVEAAYLNTAIDFLLLSGGRELTAVDLENHSDATLSFESGTPLSGSLLRAAMRSVLRNEIWARFIDQDSRFVHFGWDYYMYVGVPVRCVDAENTAHERGLFVETFTSPYS